MKKNDENKKNLKLFVLKIGLVDIDVLSLLIWMKLQLDCLGIP
jgi:hypothetical protein